MKLISNAFKNGQEMPMEFTGEGENISPDLLWQEVPANTRSFVLIVDDPDAPSKTWVHWVLYNIPASVRQIERDSYKGSLGINSNGRVAYDGPMPPSGKHRYFFKLYALDSTINVSSNPTKEMVENAMKGHILAEGQLMGTYELKKNKKK